MFLTYHFNAAVSGCKKVEFEGNNPNGEGLVDFTIKTPETGTSIILNSGTPNFLVPFSWNAAVPGLATVPIYKIVMALKTGGDLKTPFIEFVAGNLTSTTITYQELDDALKAKGIANGAKTDLIWSVQASNGSVAILSQSIFNISITRMKDGASNFVLLAPVSSTSPVTINPAVQLKVSFFGGQDQRLLPVALPLRIKLFLV
ncbi:MAG: SusE domain-containing protein [Chitinophagaceae bacterium]|nr:SusE domain-containing protein [Chitinophagaceae bacterium]